MTTPKTVQFLFDFASLNAYFAHKLVPGIEARTGARFDYVPIALGGLFKLANNRSPMELLATVPNKMAYERKEIARFVRRHGLTQFKWSPFTPVNSLQLMRGAVVAERMGCSSAYVDTVFTAVWEREKNMADPEVLAAELQAAGLDAAALIAATQEPEVKQQLIANTADAHARGAFGAPTFFVGEEMFFGKDRLGEVEEELLPSR